MCGICGVLGHKDAAFLAYLMTFAQQHRGQESAGIAVANEKLVVHKKPGLVGGLFTGSEQDFFERYPGEVAIGQNRYSTSGTSGGLINQQPFVEDNLALVFNGNITNYISLRREMEREGTKFETNVDTEVITKMLARNKGLSLEKRILEFSRRAKGAYSIIVLEKTGKDASLVFARDPLGIRPLVIGSLGNAYSVASETIAFQPAMINPLREVEPGEICRISYGGVSNTEFMDRTDKRAHCIFELIYFAMPESRIFGQSAGKFKEASGMQLAKEHPVNADFVVGVPDSATRAAFGYSRQSGIPLAPGLNRNKYSERTFINPTMRDLQVRMKLFVDPEIIGGNRIVVIDDSIVRATTTPKVINLLTSYGAREIHMRIASPPIRYPCVFGIDTPDRLALVAYNRSVEEVRMFIEGKSIGKLGSLGYLSLEDLLKCGIHKPADYCTACFSGNYPVDISEILETQKHRIEARAG